MMSKDASRATFIKIMVVVMRRTGIAGNTMMTIKEFFRKPETGYFLVKP
jgi:hypothetical protein